MGSVIAVNIPRPNRPAGGIAGGARALQTNAREREAMPSSTRPPFPIRPGDTPSRKSRMPQAFTLNFKSTRAIMARTFRPAGIRVPPPPLAGEPYPFGWNPIVGRRPLVRTPPRELTDQMLDELDDYDDSYSDPYNPIVPRP